MLSEAEVATAHVPCAGFVPIEAEVAKAHVLCAGFVPIEAKVATAHVPCAGFVPIEAEGVPFEAEVAHLQCAADLMPNPGMLSQRLTVESALLKLLWKMRQRGPSPALQCRSGGLVMVRTTENGTICIRMSDGGGTHEYLDAFCGWFVARKDS
jgi:hypothetical protein